MLRRVPFEKIENFRDLGGYAASYGETSFGVVYRSGTLADATENDIERMVSLGIKSVLDIRSENEKKAKPDKTASDPRFTQYELSVNGNGRVPVSRLDQIDSYLEMLEEPVQARQIFLTLAHCDKPCVIHCSAGKDRTGVFSFILLLANGVPFHDANADYLLSFPYLTRLTRETKRNYPNFPKPVLTPSITFWKRVMARFNKKWGTVDQYFASIGISEDDAILLENLLGKQEKSCGAVVFHGNDILVEHMKKGHYSIPKGHVEKEDPNEQGTALREISEETGLYVKILANDRYLIDYSPKPGVAKRVVFFIAESKETKTVCQEEEVSGIYWLSPNDAVRTVTHDSDKKIIIWACNLKAKLGL
jgi:protein tyrosine/serine phosphatase/8-oxo-dGTP pyrophosphatase MutT (NUDIX family)